VLFDKVLVKLVIVEVKRHVGDEEWDGFNFHWFEFLRWARCPLDGYTV
jgi:hypothetical protein